MTAKDFLYLALVTVSALVFYCHGFFSGVSRTRKVYEALLGTSEADGETKSDDATPSGAEGLEYPENWRYPHSRSSERDLRGDFGNN